MSLQIKKVHNIQNKPILLRRKADLFSSKQICLRNEKSATTVSRLLDNSEGAILCTKPKNSVAMNQIMSYELQEQYYNKRPLKVVKIQQEQIPPSLKQNMAKFQKNLKKYKKQNVIKTFLKKIKRGNAHVPPVDYDPFRQVEQQNKRKGIQLPNSLIISIFFILSISFTIFFGLFSSLTLAFEEVAHMTKFSIPAYSYGIIWAIIEIILGFTRINIHNGIKLQNLKQISMKYLKKKFIVDLFCLISLIIDVCILSNAAFYFRIAFLFKIPDCSDKIYKLQTLIIDSFDGQKKWILAKILIKNFVFAHVLAITLILMTRINQDNWLNEKNLMDAPWLQKYIWSYYWATNIMLTVGFGDINAANYQQALCLIFIETISCLVLAYNINCIGNLLSQLRIQDLEKEENFKTAKKLCDKNKVGRQLQQKFHTHIEKSFNAEKYTNFEKQGQFIKKLPQNLSNDFKIEVHYRILQNLQLFSSFTNKIIKQIAIKLQTKLTKPGQIINTFDSNFKFQIVKEGEVGYYSNFGNSKYRNVPIDIIKVKPGDNSRLISLDFLNFKPNRNYHIRSKQYSVMFELSYEIFLDIIKSKDVDFQHYFSLKDQQSFRDDQFAVISCEFCKQNHSKFRCPKLHYIPYQQNVIFKFISSVKKGKNERVQFSRKKHKDISPLTQCFKVKNQSEIDSNPSEHNCNRRSLLDRKSINASCNFFDLGITNFLLYEDSDLDLDAAKNYSYYFPKQNPDQIKTSRKRKVRRNFIKLIQTCV